MRFRRGDVYRGSMFYSTFVAENSVPPHAALRMLSTGCVVTLSRSLEASLLGCGIGVCGDYPQGRRTARQFLSSLSSANCLRMAVLTELYWAVPILQ